MHICITNLRSFACYSFPFSAREQYTDRFVDTFRKGRTQRWRTVVVVTRRTQESETEDNHQTLRLTPTLGHGHFPQVQEDYRWIVFRSSPIARSSVPPGLETKDSSC